MPLPCARLRAGSLPVTCLPERMQGETQTTISPLSSIAYRPSSKLVVLFLLWCGPGPLAVTGLARTFPHDLFFGHCRNLKRGLPFRRGLRSLPRCLFVCLMDRRCYLAHVLSGFTFGLDGVDVDICAVA